MDFQWKEYFNYHDTNFSHLQYTKQSTIWKIINMKQTVDFSKFNTVIRTIWNAFNTIIKKGFVVVIPFLIYGIVNDNSNYSFHAFIVHCYSIILFIPLAMTVFVFLLFQCEKIVELLDNKINKLKFISSIVYFITILSLTYASYYWCIYSFDNSSFKSVANDSFINTYIDFFYYSLGVFLMNNNSGIVANSVYAKIFSSTEMITTFIAIVMILSNYKSMKNPFDEHVVDENSIKQHLTCDKDKKLTK